MLPISFRLALMINNRWPIALILAASMTAVILMVIILTSVLNIRHQREIFRQELEERGRLLTHTLSDTLANPLYFLNVDKVDDVTTAIVMSHEALPYIKVFRPDGSLLTDTSSPEKPGGSLAAGFARSVIQNQEQVLEFHGKNLEVTSPIKAGNQLVGIVHFDLSTSSIDAHLADLIWDQVWQGLALLAVAAIIAFAVARYVTRPLLALRTASLSIGQGNLDEQVPVGGPEETASLGRALDRMRTELKGLYQDLEVQVADRTAELRSSNDQMAAVDEVARIITSTLEIDQVYEQFATEVRKLVDFDFGFRIMDKKLGVPEYLL